MFVQPAGTAQPDARKELDAAGSYLFPGLIDAHVHLFQHGSGFGMDADRLLSAGVTTAVDMGSAGYANFAAMHQCDLAGKKLRLKSFLNLSPIDSLEKGSMNRLEMMSQHRKDAGNDGTVSGRDRRC